MVRQVMLDYTKNGSGNYAYLSGLSNVGAKQEHPTGEAVLKRYGWKVVIYG